MAEPRSRQCDRAFGTNPSTGWTKDPRRTLFLWGILYAIAGLLAFGGTELMFRFCSERQAALPAEQMAGVLTRIRAEPLPEHLKEGVTGMLELQNAQIESMRRLILNLLDLMKYVSTLPIVMGIHMAIVGALVRRESPGADPLKAVHGDPGGPTSPPAAAPRG